MLFQSKRRSLLPLLGIGLVIFFALYHIEALQRVRFAYGEDSASSEIPEQNSSPERPPIQESSDDDTPNHESATVFDQPGCARFQPARKILVVVKTGATVIRKKLPVHFSTTLRCIPNVVIYSDMAEEFEGHQVQDVLRSISAETKENHKDFELYRQLQEYQEADRDVTTLTADDAKPAWNLDKWKFIPMMNESLHASPDADWFYFIETDTAVVWDNLFHYLSTFDASKPWYIGGQTWAGDTEFAHGGTGWAMSRPAVQLVADKWKYSQPEMEHLISKGWAGDAILGSALKVQEVSLTKSWPIFQGETPFSLDYTAHHWCYPVVSYHHVNDTWVKAISDFQNEWSSGEDGKNPLRHRDAFAHFVQPHLALEKPHWDNLCGNELSTAPSNLSECTKACEAESECLQWFYKPGVCKTSKEVRLGSDMGNGDQAVGAIAGWMMNRVEDFKKKVTEKTRDCSDRDYWKPE